MFGYYQVEVFNKQVFDSEGFFYIGDVVCWFDLEQLEKGLQFVGRVSEDFKLFNGIWVYISMLCIDL